MSLLTASRNTPEWNGAPRYHVGVLGVEASTSIYVGGMVALDANGYAVPAQVLGSAPLNSLKVIGICEYVYAGGILPPGINALNQTGNGLLYPGATGTLGAAGAISVGVAASIFGMDVDSSISSNLQVGQLAFANDDHTVSVTDGSGGTTIANTTSITVPSSGPLINVLHPYIQPGSFNAYSSTGGGGTHYVENTDFAINYQSGLFQTMAGGAISAGGTVYITYKYGLATKVAAGEVIAIDAGLAYVCVYKQSLRSPNGIATAGN
jgi:hypothetical protein